MLQRASCISANTKTATRLGRRSITFFEAMLLGSIAPGVGDEPTIDVLYPPGERSKGVYGAYLNKKGKHL